MMQTLDYRFRKLKKTDAVLQFSNDNINEGLSVFFTVLCIVDLFGVFPVITLPKSIIACGVYGAPLVIFVLGLQIYTAALLGRSWLSATRIAPHIDQKNRYPYAAIAELAFGRRARQLVTFLIDATVFGAGIPNLLVASQSLQLFWWKITGGGVGVSFCLWMLLIGLFLCPVMWLGSPKDMKPLAATSVVIVITVAICTWCCIIFDEVSPQATEESQTPRVQDFLVAYGIIAFQFDIHPMLLTIQVDMRERTRINMAVRCGFLDGAFFTGQLYSTLEHLIYNRKPCFTGHSVRKLVTKEFNEQGKVYLMIHFRWCLFAVTGAMFAVTSLLAAYRYGQNVEANILQGIPASIPLLVVALLVTLQLCLSSAVGNSALFQHVEELLHVPRDFSIRRCIVRSTIVGLAVFLGEAVPRFDLVMGLIGSTLTGPLMFILPPLLFLKLCYMKPRRVQRYEKLKNNNTNMATLDNGNSIQNQNGGDSVFQTKYKTFTSINYKFSDEVKWYDILFAFLAMLVGITATIVATYSSWSEAINYATFSQPCIVNASAAARDFLKVTKKE